MTVRILTDEAAEDLSAGGPLIIDGQGRTADDIEGDAEAMDWLLRAGCILAAIAIAAKALA